MKFSKFTPATYHQAVVARAHKNKLKPKKASFSTIFASAVGGSTIGSAFGLPGLLIGAAVGGGFGAYVEKKKHA